MISLVTEGPAHAAASAVLDRLAGVEGPPAAASGRRVVRQTTGSLGAVRAVQEVLEAGRRTGEAVALVSGQVLLHDEAAAALVLDPRQRTAAGVSVTAGAFDVRRRGGLVVSAGSLLHSVTGPDAAFVGLLVIGPTDLKAATSAVGLMAEVVASRPPRADATRADATRGGGDSTSLDPLGPVLVALVRSGIAVAAVDIDPWPWARVADPSVGDLGVADLGAADAFAGRLAAVDVRATKMARAMRPDDGFYSTFVVRRLSRRLTPLALRCGLSPNQITVGSLVIGLLAATGFAVGGRAGLVTGAVLLQVSLVVDCVDGEVARYRRAFTALGAWLDASTDRVKEYACYAGLAVGAATAGPGVDLWLLAAAMMGLQTTRHTTDYLFTLVRNVREGVPTSVPLDQVDDVPLGPLPPDEPVAERPAVRWFKKVIYLPIAERWLVISLAAAFGSPAWVFGALLTLATLALAYTTSVRAVRSRSWGAESATEREREVVRSQLDRGPLAAALARGLPWRLPMGRFAWLLPGAVRAAEFATLILVVHAVDPGAMPATFALLFAVAYHHYDALYRALNGLAPAGAVRALGLGVEGRLLVIGALSLAGSAAISRGVPVLAVLLGGLFVGVGTAGGLRAQHAPTRRPLRRETPAGVMGAKAGETAAGETEAMETEALETEAMETEGP